MMTIATAREWIWSTMATALGVVIGGAVLFLVGRGASYLPCLDAWLSPVIRVDAIDTFTRSEAKACFALHLTKLKSAVPLKYEFHVEQAYSPKLGISVYLATTDGEHARITKLEEHKPGESWVRNYCFDLPGTVVDTADMNVTGFALHRRHPLWLTQTHLPPFTIPAMR